MKAIFYLLVFCSCFFSLGQESDSIHFCKDYLLNKELDIIFDNENGTEIYCNLPLSSEIYKYEYYCVPSDSNILRVREENILTGDYSEGFFFRYTLNNSIDSQCWQRNLIRYFFDKNNHLINIVFYSNGLIVNDYELINVNYK